MPGLEKLAALDDAWTMTMYNLAPDGGEALAVSAEYRRRA